MATFIESYNLYVSLTSKPPNRVPTRTEYGDRLITLYSIQGSPDKFPMDLTGLSSLYQTTTTMDYPITVKLVKKETVSESDCTAAVPDPVLIHTSLQNASDEEISKLLDSFHWQYSSPLSACDILVDVTQDMKSAIPIAGAELKYDSNVSGGVTCSSTPNTSDECTRKAAELEDEVHSTDTIFRFDVEVPMKENYISDDDAVVHPYNAADCLEPLPSPLVPTTSKQDGPDVDPRPGHKSPLSACYQCTMCDYMSVSKGNLNRHKLKHTGEKPFKCSLCSYGTIHKWNLAVHNRKHTGEKPYKCPLCDHRAASRSAINTHLKSNIHSEKKRKTRKKKTQEKKSLFKCVICDSICTTRNELKLHMKKYEERESFECSRCDFKSTENGKIRAHIRLHEKGKSFTCSFCEFKCVSKFLIERHMRSHLALKCSFCDYKTDNRYALRSHTKKHIGLKPFECSLFDLVFTRKDQCAVHLYNHNRVLSKTM